ncbi:MAG TPA: SDR family oxidoreductase [Vineibacter sp.]|nr:SDR family oxidoreductase [Vineibacter sp.]
MASANQARRRRALVTGASEGIGRELATVFAANQFDLVLLARNRDRLHELAVELKTAHGIDAAIAPADLSEPAAPQAVFDSMREQGFVIDVLVNNAGLLFEGEFKEIAADDHLRLLQLNVVAVTALTRLFVGDMVGRGGGRVLNVASVAAFMPIPRLAVYAASKAYVLSFSEALSEELKGTGVTVTALCPGVTSTAMVGGTDLSRLPSMMIMDAPAVAREGYTACMAGKAVHVAGPANDIAVQWIKYQPDWLVRSVGGMLARMRR